MRINQPRNPSAEQWQAYLENRLSPEERARFEALLEASEADREALEGLNSLGPEAAATLVAGLHRDIDILTAPGREKRGAGLVQRLGYVRMGVAAAVLVLFGAGFWMLSVMQQQKADRQAFDRHFEPIAPQQLGSAAGQTEGGAYTEQLIPGQNQSAIAPGSASGDAPLTVPVPAPLNLPSADDLQEDRVYSFAESDLNGAGYDETRIVSEDLSAPAVSGATTGRAGDATVVVPETAQAEEQVDVVSKTAASSQPVTKTLDLQDSRKQPSPLSQKASRPKEAAKEAPAVAGAVESGQAPASEPGRLAQDEGSREDADFSPESEEAQKSLSLSEVAVVSSSKRGYKPAPDPYEQGQNAYAAGDYRMAIEWLSQVGEGHPQAHAADLLEANAWLERDKPEKAVPLLEGLKALGPGPFYDQSRWYLALAYLAQGNEDPAIALLEALVMENGPYRARALELLSDLGD